MKQDAFNMLRVGDRVYYLLSNDWPRAKVTSVRRDHLDNVLDIGVSFFYAGRMETLVCDRYAVTFSRTRGR